MVYRPRRGREVSRPRRREEGNPDFKLALLDAGGREVLSVAPQVAPYGCGRAGDPLRYRVRGLLPLHPEAASYEFRRGNILLYARTVPAVPPIVPKPECRIDGNRVTIRWRPAESRGGAGGTKWERNTACGLTQNGPADALSYDVVAAMESGRRFAVVRGLVGSACEIDLDLGPIAGKGRLYLVANDGVRSSEIQACTIKVPERPPTVHILSPLPDVPLPFGQPVSLLGCCLDMGGETCPADGLVWSLDGRRIAVGTPLAALHNPDAGRHVLTLAYRGRGRMKAATSMTIDIEEPDDGLVVWRRLIRDCFPGEVAGR